MKQVYNLAIIISIAFFSIGIFSFLMPNKSTSADSLQRPPELIVDGMVLIPAGEFEMGRTDGKPDERPVHTVYVDAFYMDIYEVTNAAYKEFIEANPQWQKDKIKRSLHDGEYLRLWDGNNYQSGRDDYPVKYVSWYAAMAYAKWKGKRLPTEAEWEKAARGNLVGKPYPWGETIDVRDANYFRHVNDTTPVGKYPPNAYGLYDMVGNVWEWCLDAYDPEFYRKSEKINPISGGKVTDNFLDVSTSRVFRGGSWANQSLFIRVDNRDAWLPDYSSIFVGFRCVKEIPD